MRDAGALGLADGRDEGGDVRDAGALGLADGRELIKVEHDVC